MYCTESSVFDADNSQQYQFETMQDDNDNRMRTQRNSRAALHIAALSLFVSLLGTLASLVSIGLQSYLITESKRIHSIVVDMQHIMLEDAA